MFSFKPHGDDRVYSIELISNGRIATSGGPTIKIWNSSPPYSATPLQVINDPENKDIKELIYFSKNDVLLSKSIHVGEKECDFTCYKVRKWDMKTLTCTREYIDWGDSIVFPMNDDTAIWGGFLIDVKTMKKNSSEKKTNFPVYCVYRVGDEVLIPEHYGKGIIRRVNIHTFKEKGIVNTTHTDSIRDISKVSDETIATLGEDGVIKIWKLLEFLQ